MTEGWKTYRLEDLCSIEIGRTPARDDPRLWDQDRSSGNVWLSIADLSGQVDGVVSDSREYVSDHGAALCKLVPAGTLLLSFKLTLGRLAVAGRPVYTNEAIAALSLRQPRLLERSYLRFFLEAFDWNKASEGDHKIKGKALNKAKLKEISVLVPPLFVQRRIVTFLDEAFEAIATAKANTEENLQNARELFESKLHALLGHAAAAWPRKTLREIAIDFGRGKSKHRPRNDPKLYGGPYPFIQTGDVRGAEHLITEYTQTYSEAGLAQSKLWPKGTLCITIAANIAETGVLNFAACFPDSVIGVVVDEKQTSSKYLEYMLHTVKAHLKAQGKGSAQDNINLATFENERFPFPDLDTQALVVCLLDHLSSEIRRLEELHSLKLGALDELKKSLLHQAFTGQLTAKSTDLQLEAVA